MSDPSPIPTNIVAPSPWWVTLVLMVLRKLLSASSGGLALWGVIGASGQQQVATYLAAAGLALASGLWSVVREQLARQRWFTALFSAPVGAKLVVVPTVAPPPAAYGVGPGPATDGDGFPIAHLDGQSGQ